MRLGVTVELAAHPSPLLQAIFPMWQTFHYFSDLETAVAGAVEAGVVAVDSGGNAQVWRGSPRNDCQHMSPPSPHRAQIVAALDEALNDGNLTDAQLDAAIQRQFEMRIRVGACLTPSHSNLPVPPRSVVFPAGEFDFSNPRNPYAGPYDESQLDGPAHRALAREVAAASIVLLQNAGGLLPLSASSPPATVAVIGPWAGCADTDGSYGCVMCHQGDYAAMTRCGENGLAGVSSPTDPSIRRPRVQLHG